MSKYPTLFETKEQREAAISHFMSLKSHAGWHLVEKILTANMEALRDKIVKNPNNLSEERLNALRKKYEQFEETLEMPDRMINALQDTQGESNINDPYFTVDTLYDTKKE